MTDLLARYDEEYKRAFAELASANILIVGKTGVGKSTLVNAIFRKQVAKTGAGKPVTRQITEHRDPALPVGLFDTPGLELGQAQELARELAGEIERRRTGDAGQHIHLVWYCIQAERRRLEDYEEMVIRRLAEHLPVILVLTQVLGRDDAESLDLARELQSWRLPIVQQRPVLTLARARQVSGHAIEPFGLDELAQLTADTIPKAVRRAFANAQQAKIQLKVDEARRAVIARTALAFGVGATPIPIADTAALVVVQVEMFARVAVIMGVDLKDETVRKLVRDFMLWDGNRVVLGGAALGTVAFSGASLLLKLGVPIVGHVITAAAAAAFTRALGESFVFVCAEILRRRVEGRPVDEAHMFRLLIDGFRHRYKPVRV